MADSLLVLIKTGKDDTSKVRNYHQLCMQKVNSDLQSVKSWNQQAFILARSLGDLKGISNAYHISGIIYYYQGQPDSSIFYHKKALNIRTKLASKRSICISNGSIGNGYLAKGEYNNAVHYFVKAVKMAEEEGDSILCSHNYNNLGLAYKNLGHLNLALNYFEKALVIKRLKADLQSQANTVQNIGLIHTARKEFALAIGYYEEALRMFAELNHLQGQSICYNNLAAVYYDQQQFQKAIEANLKSLKFKEEIGDEAGICSSYINLGADYFGLKNYDKAKGFHHKALEIAEKNGLKDQATIVLHQLSKDYEMLQDHRTALLFQRKLEALKDSLLTSKYFAQIAEVQAKYDSEKKDKEILLQSAQLKEKILQAKHAESQRNAFIIAFSSVAVLMALVFRSYRRKKKDHAEITRQNQIIQQQKQQVELKNKEITDSITYARRIQRAHLPSQGYIHKILEQLRSKKN